MLSYQQAQEKLRDRRSRRIPHATELRPSAPYCIDRITGEAWTDPRGRPED